MEEKIKTSGNDRSAASRNSQQAAGNGRKIAMEVELNSLFHALDSEGEGQLSIRKLIDQLDRSGISKNAPRLKGCLEPYLNKEEAMQTTLGPGQFINLLQGKNADLLRKQAVRSRCLR